MGKILAISRKPNLTQKEIAEAIPYPDDSPRVYEMTRDDCRDGCRPCPLVTCKFNNYLTVTEIGTILLNYPGKEPEEVPPEHSCLLDIIEKGNENGEYGPDNPMTYDEIGAILGQTRSNVQLIFESIQRKGKEFLGDDR